MELAADLVELVESGACHCQDYYVPNNLRFPAEVSHPCRELQMSERCICGLNCLAECATGHREPNQEDEQPKNCPFLSICHVCVL